MGTISLIVRFAALAEPEFVTVIVNSMSAPGILLGSLAPLIGSLTTRELAMALIVAVTTL